MLRACSLVRVSMIGLLLCVSTPLAARAEQAGPLGSPSPSADARACTDENVQRAFNAATALYKRLGNGKTPPPPVYAAWVDHLWKSAPDCAAQENRDQLSHHGFKQYMGAATMLAYEGAVLKTRARRFKDARFYIKCYRALQQGAHNEAKTEGWTFWQAFEAQSLPVIEKLDHQLRRAGW